MALTIADLKPGQAHGFLYCPSCGGEYSADSGDYWYMSGLEVFECCGEPMALFQRRCVLEMVKS